MQSPTSSSYSPVRWGVISVANIGVKHVIPAIFAASNAQLVAVASRNPQRAMDIFQEMPDLRIYGAYEALLADPDVEAIYIPLPNSLHAEWTIRALQAGKHVLCEKPLAVTAAQGMTMVEAARANDRLLMEAFMYRFHPQILWALEQVRSGRIGEPRLVRASFAFDVRPRPHDIRLQANLAGGSLMDIGCYPVNFCRAVFGHVPHSVAARVYVPEKSEVERAVNAVLDFGDGRFGLIDANFEMPARQSAEICGEQGSISIPLPFTPGYVETEVILNLQGQTIHQRIAHVDQYQLEIEHFSVCVRTGTQPVYSLDESLDNLKTIEAIYSSADYPWPPF